MTDAATIARALGGKRSGGGWSCRCPAHEDKSPSLLVSDGDEAVLVKCFAGCDPADVLRALARRGLLDDRHQDRPYMLPARPAAPKPSPQQPPADPDAWRRVWVPAEPITHTIADTYLRARGVPFADPAGEVLRFNPRAARLNTDDKLERHPALVQLLRDVVTGQPCGCALTFLRSDGADRLRDKKAKLIRGRGAGAAVMLSTFDQPALGLVIAEGLETTLAVLAAGLGPAWAIGSCSMMRGFPVLSGLEALTIAADADEPGQRAAAAVAQRWRQAGRQARIIAPPAGDWADQRQRAA